MAKRKPKACLGVSVDLEAAGREVRLAMARKSGYDAALGMLDRLVGDALQWAALDAPGGRLGPDEALEVRKAILEGVHRAIQISLDLVPIGKKRKKPLPCSPACIYKDDPAFPHRRSECKFGS